MEKHPIIKLGEQYVRAADIQLVYPDSRSGVAVIVIGGNPYGVPGLTVQDVADALRANGTIN